MHSLPILGLGIFFALAGLGLFALTLRKAPAPTSTAPVKKSELRAQEIEQRNTTKLRIAAAVSVVIGAVLMVFS